MTKLFVFYNGNEPVEDRNPLFGRGETEAEARENMARTLGHPTYEAFEQHIEKNGYDFLRKTNLVEIRNFD